MEGSLSSETEPFDFDLGFRAVPVDTEKAQRKKIMKRKIW